MRFRRFALPAVLLVFLSIPCLAEKSAISDRAESLFRDGRYADVIQLVELARKSGNATAEDLIILSVAYLNTDREADAVSVLSDAETLDPENAQIQLAIGSIALRRGDTAAAVVRFRNAYEIDPESSVVHEVLTAALVNNAAALADDGEIEEAFAALEEAVVLDPTLFMAIRNLAVLSFRSKDMDQAADYAKRAIELEPLDIDLHKIYIESLRGTDRIDSLISAISGYLELEPNDGDAHALLGRTYENAEMLDPALKSFERAEQLGTNDPYVYDTLASADAGDNRSLSRTHMAIGQAIQAISRLKLSAAGALENRELTDLTDEDWERLEEMASTLDEPLEILSRSLDRLRILHPSDEALESDLERLVEWYPSSVELKNSLAVFYEDARRWNDSYRVWRGIASADPSQAAAHVGMARALLKLNGRTAARLAARRAFEVDAESPFVYEILELCYDDEALRELLLERSRRDTTNSALFEELAGVESRIGLDEEAEKHRERAEFLRSF